MSQLLLDIYNYLITRLSHIIHLNYLQNTVIKIEL